MKLNSIKIWLKQRLLFLLGLALLLILLQLINSLTAGGLLYFGLVPRSSHGLIGIFCAPFIHGSWGHLLSNLPPLLIMSGLLLYQSIRQFIYASLFIIIMGGLLVWLFGSSAIHIGASGWIFGLWALLLTQGVLRRNKIDIIIAVIVLIYFGGMASGLLPGQQYISTSSHLSGAIAGVLYGWILRKKAIGRKNTNAA